MANQVKFLKRRRVPRRAFKSSIGLLVRGVYDIGRSFQIGEGGMLLASHLPLEVGQKVVVSFHLGSVHMVELAVVRYKNTLDSEESTEIYGVEFFEIDFMAKRRIRSYVSSKQEGEDTEHKISLRK
jgi:c-di-GMP-binding flagellar brake protein YcgR